MAIRYAPRSIHPKTADRPSKVDGGFRGTLRLVDELVTTGIEGSSLLSYHLLGHCPFAFLRDLFLLDLFFFLFFSDVGKATYHVVEVVWNVDWTLHGPLKLTLGSPCLIWKKVSGWI